MEESKLEGALSFCRMVLNQPELRLDDMCKEMSSNKKNRKYTFFQNFKIKKVVPSKPFLYFHFLFLVFLGPTIIFLIKYLFQNSQNGKVGRI